MLLTNLSSYNELALFVNGLTKLEWSHTGYWLAYPVIKKLHRLFTDLPSYNKLAMVAEWLTSYNDIALVVDGKHSVIMTLHCVSTDLPSYNGAVPALERQCMDILQLYTEKKKKRKMEWNC